MGTKNEWRHKYFKPIAWHSVNYHKLFKHKCVHKHKYTDPNVEVIVSLTTPTSSSFLAGLYIYIYMYIYSHVRTHVANYLYLAFAPNLSNSLNFGTSFEKNFSNAKTQIQNQHKMNVTVTYIVTKWNQISFLLNASINAVCFPPNIDKKYLGINNHFFSGRQ